MSEPRINCPVCEAGALTPESHEIEIEYGGARLPIRNLEGYRCASCGADPILTDQIKRNQAKIADAKRQHDRLLSGAEICSARAFLGLSQADASRIFGGGANAFSKYERGEVVQSVPMDRLLRLVIDLPLLVHYLASYAGVALASKAIVEQAYIETPLRVSAAIRGTSSVLRGRLIEVSTVNYFRNAA